MVSKYLNILLGFIFPLGIILVSNSYNINNKDIIDVVVFVLIVSTIAYIPLFFSYFKKHNLDLIIMVFLIILSTSSLVLKLFEINSLSIKSSIILWLLIFLISIFIINLNLIKNFFFIKIFVSVFFISSLTIFYVKPYLDNNKNHLNLTATDVFEINEVNKNFKNNYDFFYIVLDGFPRISNLEKINYDTNKFSELFEKYNLKVIKNTKSNYLDTQKSISSTMNFGKIKPNIDLEKKYFYKFINNSKILNIFLENNYKITWFPSDQSLSNCPNMISVNCIKSPFKLKIFDKEIIKFYLGILQFQNYWLEKINMYYLEKYTEIDYRSIYHLDILTNHFKNNDFGDKNFIFSHILVPHPPYLLNSSCKLKKFALDYKLFDRKKILEQIDCFYLQLNSFLEIVDKKFPNSVLFIHSDHGTPIISEILYGEENYENFVLINDKLNCGNNINNKKNNIEIIQSIMECM